MRSRRDVEAQAQRRLRGTRIKRGLEGLHDLDAPKPRPRTETTPETKPNPQTDAKTEAQFHQETTTEAEPSTGRTAPVPAVHGFVFGSDWGEWRRVKADLFRPDATPAVRARAFETMAVWRARSRQHRPLPAYVESTELLMRVVGMDEMNALVGARELAQAYGAAISRCVHVMTGSFAKGESGDTYRKRARKIDFPEEAVEVRQRMAHGVVPEITEMRWVCGLLLQFLFLNYWMKQEKHIKLMEASAATASGGKASKDLADEETREPASIDDMRALLHELSDGSACNSSEEDDDAGTPVARRSAAVDPTSFLPEMEAPGAGVDGSMRIGEWVIS
ncbi:unnamed protein product [Phytomonas sp. EM1]|nr:unnamed protein product [Phytomonas sp. EM1]|eukprot:CCW64971.1 unnamed protein product [Phytomonas sp. isolate EM1]